MVFLSGQTDPVTLVFKICLPLTPVDPSPPLPEPQQPTVNFIKGFPCPPVLGGLVGGSLGEVGAEEGFSGSFPAMAALLCPPDSRLTGHCSGFLLP